MWTLQLDLNKLIVWKFATGFQRWANLFELTFFKRENVPPDGQTQWAKFIVLTAN